MTRMHSFCFYFCLSDDRDGQYRLSLLCRSIDGCDADIRHYFAVQFWDDLNLVGHRSMLPYVCIVHLCGPDWHDTTRHNANPTFGLNMYLHFDRISPPPSPISNREQVAARSGGLEVVLQLARVLCP